MKIETGMFVRLKDGYIRKILGIEDSKGYSDIYQLDKDGKMYKHADYKWTRKDLIIKASYNIIDLIEVGDYVNGKEVIAIDETYSDATYINKYKYLWVRPYCDAIKNEDIKTVLTHERFEREVYKV